MYIFTYIYITNYYYNPIIFFSCSRLIKKHIIQMN